MQNSWASRCSLTDVTLMQELTQYNNAYSLEHHGPERIVPNDCWLPFHYCLNPTARGTVTECQDLLSVSNLKRKTKWIRYFFFFFFFFLFKHSTPHFEIPSLIFTAIFSSSLRFQFEHFLFSFNILHFTFSFIHLTSFYNLHLLFSI